MPGRRQAASRSISAIAGWGLDAGYWRQFAIAAVGIGTLALLPVARARITNRLLGVPLSTVLTVVALNVLYFALYAGMAIAFALQLDGAASSPELAQLAIAFLLAWLAGYIIPGAPGGIGVRESALVLLLAGGAGDSNALALALGLGMRCVNILGDLIFAAFAFALDRATAPNPVLIGSGGE